MQAKHIATLIPDPDSELISLVSAYYRLRRMGLLPPVLMEGCITWTFTDGMDPWGSREVLSREKFKQMIEDAISQV